MLGDSSIKWAGNLLRKQRPSFSLLHYWATGETCQVHEFDLNITRVDILCWINTIDLPQNFTNTSIHLSTIAYGAGNHMKMNYWCMALLQGSGFTMQYLALFVMMAMIHTSSSEIHCWPDNSWSLEYSRTGGVHCGEKHYLRGFIGRGSPVWGPSNPPIKYTKCCGAPTPIANENTTQRCEFADWNSTLGR